MSTLDPHVLVERARDEIIAAMPDVVAIYVFGSAATGHFGRGSDLDIAILGTRPCDGRSLYDLARALEARLGVDVDLVDLMTASTVLKYEVIARGRRGYCGDRDAAIEFEGRSLAEYGRYTEDFGPLFASIRESGKAYGQ